ncbi:translocation/assembly module TamB domain-containing protein [Photobacterium rosenbergii]|uniref:Translocation/assembly module TamB domain-containing protein n=1 Tax=Photobacterium rosenbergii TaxID=294936 RepID=A0ABU3ZQS0_9GAMM|nr:translocation/assembly module TamB domain-containing protein [Photobacterium rosenbergii]MDV5172442.1 translocation/assembly module TamB domain-containing protein [Photobacterium rosenbergii]
MIWVKRSAIALLALLMVLVIAVAALLYTPAGIKVAVWGAQKVLPALSIGGAQGSLLNGFSLQQVNYNDDSIELAVSQLVLDIEDSCLLTPAVCISNLAVSGVRFSMPQLPPASEEVEDDVASEPITEISLPIPVTLSRLVLDDIELDVLGNKVGWHHFSSAAEMVGNELTLKPTDWKKIELTLAPASNDTAEVTESQESPSEPIVLPEVSIPLSVVIQRFTVEDFTLHGETPQTVQKLELVASAKGSDVVVEKLEMSAPQADLNADATIALTGDYPLALKAGIAVHMAPIENHELDLNAQGSVANLILDARVKGTLDAWLKGQLSPLDPALPFDLSLDSQHLQWPIDSEPDFEVKETKLTAKGSLEGYSFTLGSQIDGKPMPAVGAELVGKGTLEDVELSRLSIDTLGGKISGNAKASWKDLVSWQGELAFSHIQPGLEWQDVPGDLSGNLKTSGGLTQQGGWFVELPELVVDGEVMGQRLDLNGQLSAKDTSGKGDIQLDTQGLALKHGPNGFSAKGRLTKTWDMAAEINAPALSQSLPGLRGSVLGSVQLKGKMAEPDLDVDLVGEALGWEELASLDKLTLKGEITPMPLLDADVSLTASGGRYDTFTLNELSLLFQGSEKQHQLVLDVNAEPVSTTLRLQGELDRDKGWRGALQQGEIDTELGIWKLDRSTAIGYRFETQLASVAAHCWEQEKGRAALCLTQNMEAGASGRANVALSNVDFAMLEPYLPDTIALKGSAEAQAEVVWAPKSAPYVKASVELPAGSVTQQQDPDLEPVTVGWDKVTINAEVKQDTLNADWLFAIRDNGDLSGRAKIAPLSGDQQLDARLKLDRLMLGFLKPLLKDYHTFDGAVDADISVTGPMMHPAVNGLLKISNVKASGQTIPVDIDRADITATFSGYQARLSGEVVTPDGKLNITGDGNWQDLANWRGQLGVNGRELEVTVPPLLAVKVSPDLVIKAAPNQAEITGRIVIPWGRITVDQLPESAVAVSDDEILLNEDMQPVETEKPIPFNIKTDVLVRIGSDVKLSAFGLKAGLVGDLNVRQDEKGPLVYGEVNLRNGTYRSFAQELVIRKGQILFNGPADQPYLSIEAIRDPNNIEDDVIAGLRVTGPADEPKVKIFSDPAMPQQNALSYILRGRDLDSESDSNDAMAATLLSMGLAKSGQLVGNVGEAFGVQDLSLDTAGSGDDTQVTISGYIAPGLQVKYGVGIFNSIPEFTVRYRLMKDLYVEVVSGLDSAADLLYQFEFN